jgi:phosphotriesterase-related protein
MTTIIRTVTGDIDPEQMGITLTHEHFIYANSGCEYDHRQLYDVEKVSDDVARQLIEGRDAHNIMGIVDMTPGEVGRNPHLIQKSAQKAGINVVATTGFFPEIFGYPEHWKCQDVDYIAEYFRRDIMEGMAYANTLTTIKAGNIKVACGSGTEADGTSPVQKDGTRITPAEQRGARAAGRTQKLIGCQINTHTEPNDYDVTNPGLELLDLFEDEGADPRKVIIGHAFVNPRMDRLEAICQRGANLQIDHIGIPWRHDTVDGFDELLARTAAELVQAGYIDHLVFSYDRFFTHSHGPVDELDPVLLNEHVDLNYLYDSFAPRLEKYGFGEKELETVLVDNPRRLLAFPVDERNSK